MKDDRLISLNAAIDAFKKELLHGNRDFAVGFVGAKRILEGLPSAQQWIPVAEGLPSKYEYVLLTCERNGKLVADFGCLSPYIDGDTSWWIAVHDLTEGWRVLAWMPLPEPYKEHDDG